MPTFIFLLGSYLPTRKLFLSFSAFNCLNRRQCECERVCACLMPVAHRSSLFVCQCTVTHVDCGLPICVPLLVSGAARTWYNVIKLFLEQIRKI